MQARCAESFAGKRIRPVRSGAAARKIAETNCITQSMFRAFAVRDGNLITGATGNAGMDPTRILLVRFDDAP